MSTGTTSRKYTYSRFGQHYLQSFKTLLQGKIFSFLIKNGRIGLESKAEEILSNETSLGLTLQWYIKT